MFDIAGIYHSGRKGPRWQQRTEDKFDGLLGCRVEFDPQTVERFEGYHFIVKNSPIYSWWNTTGIVQLSRDFDGNYVMETVNTIYILKEVEG